MLLYHGTDEAGRDGIERQGFARSDLADSPHGSWLVASKDDPQAATRGTWRVVVDLPDHVAAQYECALDDGSIYAGVYYVPWTVLNEHRPFTFQRVTE